MHINIDNNKNLYQDKNVIYSTISHSQITNANRGRANEKKKKKGKKNSTIIKVRNTKRDVEGRYLRLFP